MSADLHRSRSALLFGLCEAARAAGEAILQVRAEGFQVEAKSDLSPVTAADRAAEAILLAALARLAPGAPVVAEEEAAAGRIPEVGPRFFLVDALDGTREFVRGGADFTVNIGLVEETAPTLGVVYAPVSGALYWGDVRSEEAWMQRGVGAEPTRIHVRAPSSPPLAVASRSHCTAATEAYLHRLGVDERTSIGSSLKFCLLAQGLADLYPRCEPTSEWDTAAGHAILLAAGGEAYDRAGGLLRYAKPDFFNPGFLAVGGLRDLPPLD